MDIFRFINSRDIREHLKEIDYPFNTCEAAWLVGHALTATLQERFDAWEEIIAAMPDCAPPWPFKTAPESDSFHALLREYMALYRKKLAWFYDPEDAVYQYELEKASDDFFDDNGMYSDLFPDLESCRCGCVEGWEIEEEDADAAKEKKIFHGRIVKRCLRRLDDGGEEKKMEASVNKQGELLSLDYDWGIEWDDHERELEHLLDKMWIDFPTPFERGDILINIRAPLKPFVLSEIISWDSRRLLENGFLPEKVKEREAAQENESARAENEGIEYRPGKGYWALSSEGVDYWPSDDYWAWYSGAESQLYMENTGSYMDLERYNAPLQGEYRILKPVSCFLKEWISDRWMDIGLLCNACHLIWQEEQSRKFQDSLYYTDKALQDYGIPEKRGEKG